LTFVLDQPPGPNVKAMMGLGPVIENHLPKDFAAILVDKVIQFDQVDALFDHGRCVSVSSGGNSN
jgi:hypothetical protein